MVSFSRYCGCAFLGAVVICVLICGARPTQATPPSGYTLLFHDEFNQGALDQNDWYYRTGLRRTCYDLARNAWVAPDGILHLAFANADPAYRVDGGPQTDGRGDYLAPPLRLRLL